MDAEFLKTVFSAFIAPPGLNQFHACAPAARGQSLRMLQPEDIVGGEWAEWYRMSPLERWHASGELWAHFLSIGGSLDPEPDSESPFYDGRAPGPCPADGRSGLRVLRRSGV